VSEGYGVEAWCADAYVSGRFSRGWRTVALAIYRRLITSRGMLRGGDDEQNYGLDLSEYVGAVGYPTALLALPNIVAAEIEKDDRVLGGSVIVTPTTTTGADGLIDLVLEIRVTLVDEGESFALTVGVDEVTAELLDIRLA
jgi:hypothetical protein